MNPVPVVVGKNLNIATGREGDKPSFIIYHLSFIIYHFVSSLKIIGLYEI